MESNEMKKRTKSFALRIIRLVESLPKGETSDVIGRQLLRSVELLVRASLVEKDRVCDLMDEANQIAAMVVSSIKTARKNKK